MKRKGERKLKVKWTRGFDMQMADEYKWWRHDPHRWNVQEAMEAADYYLIVGKKANEWI